MLLHKAFFFYSVVTILLLLALLASNIIGAALAVFLLYGLALVMWIEGNSALEYTPGRMIDKLVSGDDSVPTQHIRRYKIVQDARLKETDDD